MGFRGAPQHGRASLFLNPRIASDQRGTAGKGKESGRVRKPPLKGGRYAFFLQMGRGRLDDRRQAGVDAVGEEIDRAGAVGLLLRRFVVADLFVGVRAGRQNAEQEDQARAENPQQGFCLR